MANSNGSTQIDKADQQEMRRVKPAPMFKQPPNSLINYTTKPKDPPARPIKKV